MSNGNWFGRFGGGRGRGYPVNLGVQDSFPTQFEQPRVSPTQEYVQTNRMNTVVPHVHPSHLTTINHHHIEHQHHFPHTQSMMHHCTEQHTMCGQPFQPRTCGCMSGCQRCRGW